MNGYRTALVTGASRGIGEAVAVALAEAGLDVALFARSEGDLARVAKRVRATGRDVLVLAGDVMREEDVEGGVREVEARWGAVDVLVNNAGIGVFKPTWEIAADEWRRVLDVNLTGPFLFCKAVVPGMIARGRGQIVMISSDVGRRTIPDGAAYCASKFGLQALTEVLRKEVRAKGVKVGAVLPGMTDTYFAGSVQGDPRKADWLKADDVARAVLAMVAAPPHAQIDEITLHPMIQEY